MKPEYKLRSRALERASMRLDRRGILRGISACAATLAGPGSYAQALRCIATPDSGEGPFYFDPSLVRADVREGAFGAPLDIAIRIDRAGDCAPLAGARLDLWQADGFGLYSGYEDQPGVGIASDAAVGRTYLRGTQFADADGWVRFKTIYPSWYGGRTPHLHFKVFLQAREVVASQIFFDDEVNAEVFSEWEPYRDYVDRRTVFNDNDRFLDLNGDARIDGVFCEIDSFDRSGLTATAIIGVENA